MEKTASQFQDHKELSPEEAGCKMGAFLRGLDESQKRHNSSDIA